MTRPRRTRLILGSVSATGLLLSAASHLHAQAVTTVERKPVCATCQITTTRQFSLGDRGGDGEVGTNSWLACSSRGHFAAVSMARRGEILVFDSAGRFLRVLGRRGQGPGEYGVIFPIRYGPGDSLYLNDLSNSRLTVLSPSLSHVRTTVLAARPTGIIPLANGSLVVQVPMHSPDRIGLPLHMIDARGSLGRSFGSLSRVSRPDNQYLDARRIARAARGEVWSARDNEYTLERWDTAGVLHQTLKVNTPWFAPWEQRPSDGPAPPLIVDVQEDRSGLLWVLITVADPSFKAASAKSGPTGAPARTDPWKQYDSVLEVIDPRTARVLASRRFDDAVSGFACDRTVFANREDDIGNPSIRVWSMALSRRP